MPFEARKIRGDLHKHTRTQQRTIKAPSAAAPSALMRKLQTLLQISPSMRNKNLQRVLVGLAAIFAGIIVVLIAFKGIIAIKSLSVNFFSLGNEALVLDESGRHNVLLLGEGDSDHDGTDLTDTIMIGSVDTKLKNVVLLSLPRDLYFLETKEMGKGRINSLYRNYKGFLMRKGEQEKDASVHAMQQLATELSTILGITIHETVKVDFTGFEQAIDAIGGIDIDVPYDIEDTQFPGANYTYETFQIRKGMQHLDGKTTLKYARSRHTTSDFARSERQQQIIETVVRKLASQGLIHNVRKVTDLLKIANSSIEMTSTTSQIFALAKEVRDINQWKFSQFTLSDRNGLYGDIAEVGGFLYSPPREQFEGAAILLPVSVPEFPVTWKQPQVFTNIIFQHRDLFSSSQPRIAILNASKKTGLASKLGNELLRYGFNVVVMQNFDRSTPKPTTKESFITSVIPGDTASMQHPAITFLSKTLNLQSISLGNIPPLRYPADIIIVLTENYKFTPLQDLFETSKK